MQDVVRGITRSWPRFHQKVTATNIPVTWCTRATFRRTHCGAPGEGITARVVEGLRCKGAATLRGIPTATVVCELCFVRNSSNTCRTLPYDVLRIYVVAQVTPLSECSSLSWAEQFSSQTERVNASCAGFPFQPLLLHLIRYWRSFSTNVGPARNST